MSQNSSKNVLFSIDLNLPFFNEVGFVNVLKNFSSNRNFFSYFSLFEQNKIYICRSKYDPPKLDSKFMKGFNEKKNKNVENKNEELLNVVNILDDINPDVNDEFTEFFNFLQK